MDKRCPNCGINHFASETYCKFCGTTISNISKSSKTFNFPPKVKNIKSTKDIEFENLCNLIIEYTNSNFSPEQKDNLHNIYNTEEGRKNFNLLAQFIKEQQQKPKEQQESQIEKSDDFALKVILTVISILFLFTSFMYYWVPFNEVSSLIRSIIIILSIVCLIISLIIDIYFRRFVICFCICIAITIVILLTIIGALVGKSLIGQEASLMPMNNFIGIVLFLAIIAIGEMVGIIWGYLALKYYNLGISKWDNKNYINSIVNFSLAIVFFISIFAWPFKRE